MEKLKIEDFRAISKQIDKIFGNFITYITNEDLL